MELFLSPKSILAHHHVSFGLAAVVALSLASAASYGIAAVLQHRAALAQPPDLSMRAGLLLELLKNPIWLFGNVLDGVGYLFQFLALRRGSLALVEPLLVSSIAFALPVSAWLDRRRVSLAQANAAVAIAAGLALFIGVANPGAGRPYAHVAGWIGLTVAIVAVCGVSIWVARVGSRPRAAIVLAGAAGAAFGYVAALTEHVGHVLDYGAIHALGTWTPYALLMAGVVTLLLTQSAYQAGALKLSLPTLTIVQPLVAIAIGLGLFGEHINLRGPAPVFEVLGLLAAALGLFALARTPVISGDEEQAPPR